MRIPVQCNGRRFVWAEDLPPSELCDPAVLDLLQRRGVGLVTSVRPGVRPDLGCLLRRCRERDVDVCLWPMLGNADGRWFSAVNADVFAAFCDELLAELDRDGHRVLGMAFDLEPPIATVRALLRGELPAWRPPASGAADRPLHRLVARVRERGMQAWAAIVPTIVHDAPRRPGWQRLLGTPVDGVGFDCVSPMLYTSIAEGYSRGVLRREDALAWLAANALRCRARFGAAASVSLGAIGTGAIGNEPTYAAPEQLAEDVDVVLAAGIDHLVVFDLGGMLARPAPERWLDAMCRPPGHAAARPSWRARALDRASTLVSRVGSLWPAR